MDLHVTIEQRCLTHKIYFESSLSLSLSLSLVYTLERWQSLCLRLFMLFSYLYVVGARQLDISCCWIETATCHMSFMPLATGTRHFENQNNWNGRRYSKKVHHQTNNKHDQSFVRNLKKEAVSFPNIISAQVTVQDNKQLG